MKNNETIAKFLKITKFPFIILDDNGNKTYHEKSDGFWSKKEYDSAGNRTYYEKSDGLWVKRGYDSAGNITYHEDSDGLWVKQEYDSSGNEIYYEDSSGIITDNRPKTTIYWEEISEKFGIDPDKMKIEKKGS